MTLTQEQVAELKRQLSEQINNLPPEQREQAQHQIDNMNAEALEAMLKQQQAQQRASPDGQQPARPPETQKGIFRMIVDGDVPSKKLDENKEAVGVVSKRAVSKGHVLVIPKKAVEDSRNLPAGALSLAKKIARKMALKLKASSTEIQTSSAFGETIVNVIPVYDKPVNANSEAYESSEEEMTGVYDLFRVVKKPKIEKIKIKKKKQEEVLKLKRRVP